MPLEALEIAHKFMNKPINILIKRDELTLEGIKQFYVNVEKEDCKLDTLCDLYETLTITQCIIFVNTCCKVDWLAGKMMSRGHAVSGMHGDMDKETRDVIMREFSSGSSPVLITTDMLARGINVQQVSLVISYDLPTQAEKTTSTALAVVVGLGGRVLPSTFVTREDESMLCDLQRFYNATIEELPENIADLF